MATNCLHCDAPVTRREILDGWCDGCGKKLPYSMKVESNRETKEMPAAPSSRNAIPAGAILLSLILGAALLYILVTSVLGEASSTAFLVKFAGRVALFTAVALPIAVYRSIATR